MGHNKSLQTVGRQLLEMKKGSRTFKYQDILTYSIDTFITILARLNVNLEASYDFP